MISINKHKQPIASVQDSVLLCPVDRHNYAFPYNNEADLGSHTKIIQTVVTVNMKLVFSKKLFISFQ